MKIEKSRKSSLKSRSAVAGMDAAFCCPVIGIGASAGGLAAFKAFFSHMPEDSGMAFILVPHLDPTHQSLMVELLAQQTKMPVCEARENMLVEANHVYIIPPAKYLSIEHTGLHLSTPPRSQKVETAIDHFLRSLAMDQQQRAIGIILSGTSSHGTSGLQSIKAAGGMTMVQTPASAEYDSMPKNAIDSGVVDYILPPEEMPAVLIRYAQHRYVSGSGSANEQVDSEHEQLDRVLTLLRIHTKYDFRYYRKNMIKRRVLRRMGLNHINQLSDYSELLSRDPQEAKQLFRDLLIGVTGFFREPEAFRVLEQSIIPEWIARNDKDTPVRIWVPGCATGEEAYSIAILLIEHFSAAQQPLKLQVFATDIDEVALDIARQGLYPVSIAADIPEQRLARFFTQSGSHYLVSKQVRESVVFAAQNLISDAPFSKLDLISCRNLLIYIESELQQKVISLFHFALKQDGFLFLGSSETLGRHVDLFQTLSKKWRVFRRIGLTRRDIVEFPISPLSETRSPLTPALKPLARREINFAEITRNQLLKDYAPASVLINRKYEVLYYQGATGDFLEAPTGEPTRDLIAMARQGLQGKLRAACYKAIHEDKPVIDAHVRVCLEHSWRPCSVAVKPVLEPRQAEGLLLVTFQMRAEEPEASSQGNARDNASLEESSLVSELEYELKITRDDLQSSIEDMNSSNEELKASNEEIMSMNEELQSANEELETSKEELQSLNEELSTVNNQLQDKLEELDKSHNDMRNLLNSSDVGTLFLDTGLAIRQFTPSTAKLLGLLETDKGRSINTFATEFTAIDLQQDAQRVLETLTPMEKMLKTSDGHHFLRRILPYRTADNRIDGLVVTFFDITQRIEADEQARRLAAVLRDSNDAITVFDISGQVMAWNRGAEQLYGYTEAEALQMNLSEIVPSAHLASMQGYLQRIAAGEQVKSFDSARLAKDGRVIPVWVSLTPLLDESGKPSAMATTERDISERLQLDVLRVETDRLSKMVENLPVGAVYREQDQLFINRAAEEITGYTREELQTLDQWFDSLYGDQAVKMRTLYEQQRSAGFPDTSGPVLHLRKNGERRFVEYAAYRFDQHEIWILHDITQRHEAEIALRNREDRLQAVMNSAAEAIVVIDRRGVISDFNKAAQSLFGYSADEATGHNVKQLMPLPHRELHDAYLQHYIETGEPRIMKKPRELTGCHKNGTRFPLLLNVTEVDHLGIFVGIIHDLTDQKRLEKLVADISTEEQERIGLEIHDGLGQQLTGLSLLASSIKTRLERKNDPEFVNMNKLIEYLRDAISSARALSRGLVPVPVTPEGLADALVLLVQDVQTSTGIHCHFESQHDVEITDRTNAMQIYRIAQEAVNNAVKHAKPEHINIVLDAKEKQCQLTIRDDGCGFDPYNKGHEGIGIRIMHYRAGIIGCSLSIESAPGKGTQVSCKNGAA